MSLPYPVAQHQLLLHNATMDIEADIFKKINFVSNCRAFDRESVTGAGLSADALGVTHQYCSDSIPYSHTRVCNRRYIIFNIERAVK